MVIIIEAFKIELCTTATWNYIINIAAIIVFVSLTLNNIILIIIIITIVMFALHTHSGQIGLTQLTPRLKVF